MPAEETPHLTDPQIAVLTQIRGLVLGSVGLLALLGGLLALLLA